MNSQEYLELTESLKESFDKNEKIKNKHINDYNKLYKNMSVIYGLIRTFQDNDDDLTYHHLIDEIRGIASPSLFSHLVEID